MRLRLLIAALPLTLIACATSLRRDAEPAPAPPALAPPAAISPRSAAQVIRAAYGAREATLRTAIEVDADSVRVVGVSATGQRLFSARYDGRAISAERSAFVPADIAPERVLADMQLALWPLAAVQAAARATDATVTEPFAGVRRLRRGDRLVAEVHYGSADPWNGRLWFVNLEFGYTLTIDTTPN